MRRYRRLKNFKFFNVLNLDMSSLPTLKKALNELDYYELRILAGNLKIIGRSKMSAKELKDAIYTILKDEEKVLEILRNLSPQSLGLLDILRDYEGCVSKRVLQHEYGKSYSTYKRYIDMLKGLGMVFYDGNNECYFVAREMLKILNDFVQEEERPLKFDEFLENYLTLNQLKYICSLNGLKVSGRKNELIERIMKSKVSESDILNVLLVQELREILDHMGLVKSGRKDELISRILEQLSISKVKKYTVSEEKKSKPVKKERKRSKIEELWEELSDYIEKEFMPVAYRKNMSERDLEMQLYNHLQGAFKSKGHKIEYEKLKKKGRLDLVVDDVIGIELKFRPSKSDYQRLIGQIEDYLEDFKRIIVVLAVSTSANPSTTEAYKTKLETKGVKVIVKPL